MQPVLDQGEELASLRHYNRILASALAGLAGGAAMLAVWVVAFASLGRPPWRPLQLAASAVLGDSALLPSSGIGTLAMGCLVHAAGSAAFGGLFGRLTATRSVRLLLCQGVAFGTVLACALQFVVLPRALSLAWALRMPFEVTLPAHLVFGATLAALLLPIERRLIAREFEERAEHPSVVSPRRAA